jgi:hypothetical protein
MLFRVPYIFWGVSSVSTRDAERPADMDKESVIAEEVDVGGKGSGDTTNS